ncbi:MAG: FAD-dependent oxidoreductase [Ignavibacteria bacterium]|nr:FAD-dependent oxidoreductase [Ignavibacteria bacterium]
MASHPASRISHPGSNYDVIIIGGGLSGLAAAVELASRGASVALFEQSQRLGGRCYSYVDEKTGDVVDNGQHVLLGAYRNTLRYLSLIGTRNLLKEEGTLRLPLYHPEKGRAVFRILPFPKPLHLTAGALKFKLLSWYDRKKLLDVGLELMRWNPGLERKLSSLTITEWLEGLHQSDEARRCVWFPIAISVMNEVPERASALLFARSLKQAFLGKQSDSALLLPTVGQTELYVTGAEKFLQEREVKLFITAEVQAIEVMNASVGGIRVQGRGLVRAEKVIGTVPYYALEKILPREYLNVEPFAHLRHFDSSPIVSIHLWFDREFMEDEYIGLIDGTVQWLFNRHRMMNKKGKKTSYLSAVISGARGTVDLTKEELVRRAVNDIHAAYPNSGSAILVHSLVIKEKRATFSPTNEVEQLRPSAETSIEGLYLAGDWTATGLPATIEGAVLSGFRAAKLVR